MPLQGQWHYRPCVPRPPADVAFVAVQLLQRKPREGVSLLACVMQAAAELHCKKDASSSQLDSVLSVVSLLVASEPTAVLLYCKVGGAHSVCLCGCSVQMDAAPGHMGRLLLDCMLWPQYLCLQSPSCTLACCHCNAGVGSNAAITSHQHAEAAARNC